MFESLKTNSFIGMLKLDTFSVIKFSTHVVSFYLLISLILLLFTKLVCILFTCQLKNLMYEKMSQKVSF